MRFTHPAYAEHIFSFSLDNSRTISRKLKRLTHNTSLPRNNQTPKHNYNLEMYIDDKNI